MILTEANIAATGLSPQEWPQRDRNSLRRRLIAPAFLALFSLFAHSQSVYLPLDHKHAQFLNRIDILMQDNPYLNLSTIKPYDRRPTVEAALAADSTADLTTVDRHNLQSLLMNSSEWHNGDQSSFLSKKNLWNTIYKYKANLFQVDEKDFFLAVNPVIQFQQSKEIGNDQRIFLNARGVTLRGLIARRVGFYTSLVENLERTPLFVQDYTRQTRAIPGAGRFYKYKSTGADYSDARGGITFNAAQYINFQFAYDKNFIGNGYRSLFLSDFGSSYLFLKINTRIWKLNYQNIFMELNPQFPQAVRDRDLLLDKKYASIHHLSVNATRWLNLGLFEAVVFGRKNHFDFSYLNPIIFLRTAEKQNNSPDNGIVGFDFKANIGKKAQAYGQLMFDELIIKELVKGSGWFGNKYGVQLGGKYINVFNVDNLDMQAELNLVRPFTYTHYDSVSGYSHYNQPLAHPFGANFIEVVGIVRYQPLPKLTTAARLIAWKQGVDTGNANYGGDIFKLYNTRSAGDYGYSLPSGPPANGINFQLSAAYELRENLFFDATILLRKRKTQNNLQPLQETKMVTAGLRMNIGRREYDY